MVFIKLNNGRTENLIHISQILQEENDIVYQSAKGSLDGYREHFETKEQADQRYNELKELLLDQ